MIIFTTHLKSKLTMPQKVENIKPAQLTMRKLLQWKHGNRLVNGTAMTLLQKMVIWR